MSKYQVIVGNLGTVYEGDDRIVALGKYATYVSNSKTGYEGVGRCTGESVTLMEDGEPEKEHLGYQHLYEEYADWELQGVICSRRGKDPKHCPVCPTELTREKGEKLKEVTTVYFGDNGDHEVLLKRKCPGCGFSWTDVYKIHGARLPNG